MSELDSQDLLLLEYLYFVCFAIILFCFSELGAVTLADIVCHRMGVPSTL